jgi:hypothetical protein
MSEIPGCPDSGLYVATGTQTGSDVTFTDPDGGTYSAVMCGDIVIASTYSFMLDGDMVTVSNQSFTVTGDSLSGGFDWEDDDECAGTGTLSGTRL